MEAMNTWLGDYINVELKILRGDRPRFKLHNGTREPLSPQVLAGVKKSLDEVFSSKSRAEFYSRIEAMHALHVRSKTHPEGGYGAVHTDLFLENTYKQVFWRGRLVGAWGKIKQLNGGYSYYANVRFAGKHRNANQHFKTPNMKRLIQVIGGYFLRYERNPELLSELNRNGHLDLRNTY